MVAADHPTRRADQRGHRLGTEYRVEEYALGVGDPSSSIGARRRGNAVARAQEPIDHGDRIADDVTTIERVHTEQARGSGGQLADSLDELHIDDQEGGVE